MIEISILYFLGKNQNYYLKIKNNLFNLKDMRGSNRLFNGNNKFLRKNDNEIYDFFYIVKFINFFKCLF